MCGYPVRRILFFCVSQRLHLRMPYVNVLAFVVQHASHVTMSVVKLLSRVVKPTVLTLDSHNGASLHDRSYGITSDPLTQFSCAFSALIHDADQ